MIHELTAQDLEALLDLTPKALPDNPTKMGWTAQRVKEKMWQGYQKLFSFLKRLSEEVSKFSASDIEIDSDIPSITLKNDKGEALKVITLQTAESITQNEEKLAKGKRIFSFVKSEIAELDRLLRIDLQSAKDDIRDILSGTKTVGGAYKDSAGNMIVDTYETKSDATAKKNEAKEFATQEAERAYQNAKSHSDTIVTNALSYVNGEYRQGERRWTNDLVNSTSNQDRSYALGVASEKGNEALQKAKTYADNNKVDKSDIYDGLTNPSTSKVLSANQGRVLKGMIDQINNILSSDDTSLDTIKEIVDFIKNNKNVIDTISTNKINYSDIIDNYDSQLSDKPLSARVGYLLKAMIDLKADALSVYTKSEVYTKDEIDLKMFGSGMVSVDDYNQDTGMITIRYNAGAVTPSYNDSTGVLTFTY